MRSILHGFLGFHYIIKSISRIRPKIIILFHPVVDYLRNLNRWYIQSKDPQLLKLYYYENLIYFIISLHIVNGKKFIENYHSKVFKKKIAKEWMS